MSEEKQPANMNEENQVLGVDEEKELSNINEESQSRDVPKEEKPVNKLYSLLIRKMKSLRDFVKPSAPASKLYGILIRKGIFCTSLAIFVYALSALIVIGWGYYSSQKEYEDLNEEVVVIGEQSVTVNMDTDDESTDDSAEEDDTAVPYLDISVDETKLKALNDDYAFYIVIPGTNIQYPVVQGEDNDHYLRYTYSNKENTAGAIALDYRTDRDTYLQSFNTIITGHNRQDGTMFSDLANYKDESFRDEYPYVYIIMGDEEYVYEIFSFYEMTPVAVCYNPLATSSVYLEFALENNSYELDITVTTDDNIITMYTCNEDSSMRYLCHAVLRAVYELQ